MSPSRIIVGPLLGGSMINLLIVGSMTNLATSSCQIMVEGMV